MRARFLLLIGFTALSFIALASTLYNLQITKGEYYEGRALAQSGSASTFAPERGSIYFTDKNGVRIPAVLNKESPVIYIVPKEILDKEKEGKADSEEIIQRVATVLAMDVETLRPALKKPKSQYLELVSQATDEQVSAINSAGITGVYVGQKKNRFYQYGPLAAHVLGFVGLSQESDVPEGKYGVEAFFDDRLSGISSQTGERLPKGEDVVLTIDNNVQSRAEEILQTAVQDYKAVAGEVIVQDPTTGKIMAMAAWPTFNPNHYGSSSLETFKNPMVQSQYEPGSIFKVLTMAAGVDSGAITPQTTYYDTGSLTLNTKTIKNWDLKAHGTLTMTEVIEGSINTGAAFAQRKTGQSAFYNYLLAFGFKDLTDIELPGEVTGRLTPLEKNVQEINYATAAFGQGVAVTPIRLITAISTLANHGLRVEPYIVEGSVRPEPKRVVSEESARQVTGMMVSAVKKAKVASIPSYDVAGKTGTAQIPDFKNGGYISFAEGLINTYIGFAPAYNPRFTIFIRLDKPAGAPLAGTTVVPAFRELAEFLLNYYAVAPSKGQ